MQLSTFTSGVNRIFLNKIPCRPIGLLNLFNIFILLIFSIPQIQGMRVHSVSLKSNISLREGIDSNISQQHQHFPSVMEKKLRKLPHVFNNVLELPFRYEADITVEEKEGFFRFVAKTELEGGGNYGQVRAQVVEIYPGITKIVVTNGNGESKLLLEELNVDIWRYRLPASMMPELAKAVVVEGELIVTVPKGVHVRGEFDDGSRRVWGDGGRLVLVP